MAVQRQHEVGDMHLQRCGVFDKWSVHSSLHAHYGAFTFQMEKKNTKQNKTISNRQYRFIYDALFNRKHISLPLIYYCSCSEMMGGDLHCQTKRNAIILEMTNRDIGVFIRRQTRAVQDAQNVFWNDFCNRREFFEIYNQMIVIYI